MAFVDESAGKNFLFLGNSAWLDFVNTEVMSSGNRVDLLESPDDLVRWITSARLVDEAEIGAVRSRWGDAARVLEPARRFRQGLRDIAERLAAREAIDDDALAPLNAALSRSTHTSRVVRSDHGFRRLERWSLNEPEDLLVPIAESARDLLCEGDLSLVRRCRNPSCILFFYDTTKNHARAWCSMGVCGNRTKVAAHYRRRKGAAKG